MTQPGYQEGSERGWWWKVAKHLDEAQLASVNAMAHNLDDQSAVFALQDKLREAQAILLHIFRVKGLLPSLANGVAEAARASPSPFAPAPTAEEAAANIQEIQAAAQESALLVPEVAVEVTAQPPEVPEAEAPAVPIQDVAVQSPEVPKA